MAVDFNLKDFLDKKVDEYNQPNFIPNDPISIPHQFSSKNNIEITGFLASIMAWGQRKTIINKCNELIERMDGAPYDYIMNHSDQDLKSLLGFKHRTFNDTDILYFVAFFRYHYSHFASLEDAFLVGQETVKEVDLEQALNAFKHISSPAQKSTVKRINMFLRWMVRKDNKGVDFGIWNRLSPKDLICPCDVHVERVARKFGLITLENVNWKTAQELTGNLRLLDPNDPVKYDFALFGLGVEREL
ncbi:MAG: TIGR02757 family protein [Sphingobacterium sp.]